MAGIPINCYDKTGKKFYTGDCIKIGESLGIVLGACGNQGLRVCLINGDLFFSCDSRNTEKVGVWQGYTNNVQNEKDLRLTFQNAARILSYKEELPDKDEKKVKSVSSQEKHGMDCSTIPSLSIPPPVPAKPVNLKPGTRLNRLDMQGTTLRVGDCVRHAFKFAIVLEAFQHSGLKVVYAGGVVSNIQNSLEVKYLCLWQGRGKDITCRAEISLTFEYGISLISEHVEKLEALFDERANKSASDEIKRNFPVSCERTDKDTEKPVHSVPDDSTSKRKTDFSNEMPVSVKAGTRLQRFDNNGNQLVSGDCVMHKDRVGIVLNHHETQGLKVIISNGAMDSFPRSTDCEFMCSWQSKDQEIVGSSKLGLTFATAITTRLHKIKNKGSGSRQPADKDTENPAHNVPEDLKLKLVVNFLNEMPLTCSQSIATQLYKNLGIRNFTSYSINGILCYQDPALRNKNPEDVQKARFETLQTFISLFLLDGLPWEEVKTIVDMLNETQHDRVRDQLLPKDTDCEM